METRATKLQTQQDNPKSRQPCKHLEGIAAPFNSATIIQDGRGRDFRELIRPGAFTQAIKTGDIRALVDHDAGRILARQKSGTLRLEERKDGLWFSMDLPSTREGKDIRKLVERGDLDAMSFAWADSEDTWTQKDGMAQRELLSIGLQEISIVAFPAYQKTSCELRSSGLWQYKLKILRARIDNA